MSEFIVTETTSEERVVLAAALFTEGKMQELQIQGDTRRSLVGNIYVGYVEQVASQIGGAFLRIDKNTRVFLPLKHGTLRASRRILFQITKDAAGRKEPVATQNLSVSGKYAVVSKNPGKLSFSAKLEEERKTLLRKWLTDEEIDGIPHRVLVRTAAAWCEKADLIREIHLLVKQLDGILAKAEDAKTGKLLYEPDPFYIRMLKGFPEVPDRLTTDIPAVYDCLSAYEETYRDGAEPVSYENRRMPLDSLYNLPREIEKLLQKQVWLKSGAFLVIEQTEAFVGVDVNTGKNMKGKIPEETYRRINLEAAWEIGRQLRLRNLSGMILVDFISMKSDDHKTELIAVMKKAVRPDHVHTEVIDLTPLGIMEIVRQKTERPLAEEILTGRKLNREFQTESACRSDDQEAALPYEKQQETE